MRIVAISDTHARHWNLPPMPDGDILVCAGDVIDDTYAYGARDFFKWCLNQPVDDIVIVAGNHDFFLERQDIDVQKVIAEVTEDYSQEHKHVPRLHYLCDSGVEIKGLKFWGSPWTPIYGGWAFMKEDEFLLEYFMSIPEGLDILVTHGPPKDILDTVLRRKGYGLNVGSATLRARVEQVKPRVHVFGHIHEHGGSEKTVGNTRFINVASHNERYSMRPSPWTVFEVPSNG